MAQKNSAGTISDSSKLSYTLGHLEQMMPGLTVGITVYFDQNDLRDVIACIKDRYETTEEAINAEGGSVTTPDGELRVKPTDEQVMEREGDTLSSPLGAIIGNALRDVVEYREQFRAHKQDIDQYTKELQRMSELLQTQKDKHARELQKHERAWNSTAELERRLDSLRGIVRSKPKAATVEGDQIRCPRCGTYVVSIGGKNDRHWLKCLNCGWTNKPDDPLMGDVTDRPPRPDNPGDLSSLGHPSDPDNPLTQSND